MGSILSDKSFDAAKLQSVFPLKVTRVS